MFVTQDFFVLYSFFRCPIRPRLEREFCSDKGRRSRSLASFRRHPVRFCIRVPWPPPTRKKKTLTRRGGYRARNENGNEEKKEEDRIILLQRGNRIGKRRIENNEEAKRKNNELTRNNSWEQN